MVEVEFYLHPEYNKKRVARRDHNIFDLISLLDDTIKTLALHRKKVIVRACCLVLLEASTPIELMIDLLPLSALIILPCAVNLQALLSKSNIFNTPQSNQP